MLSSTLTARRDEENFGVSSVLNDLDEAQLLTRLLPQVDGKSVADWRICIDVQNL